VSETPQVTTTEILTIIGTKEVEIIFLRNAIATATQRIRKLEEELVAVRTNPGYPVAHHQV
jgi:hypothetical protein